MPVEWIEAGQSYLATKEEGLPKFWAYGLVALPFFPVGYFYFRIVFSNYWSMAAFILLVAVASYQAALLVVFFLALMALIDFLARNFDEATQSKAEHRQNKKYAHRGAHVGDIHTIGSARKHTSDIVVMGEKRVVNKRRSQPSPSVRHAEVLAYDLTHRGIGDVYTTTGLSMMDGIGGAGSTYGGDDRCF